MGDLARHGPLGARRLRRRTLRRERQIGDRPQVHRRDGGVIDRVDRPLRRLRRRGEAARQLPRDLREKVQAHASLLSSVMIAIYEENRRFGMENRAAWV